MSGDESRTTPVGDREFESNAKVTRWGVMFPREGVLTLADGRLSFVTRSGKAVFDVPAEDASSHSTAWYMWGTSFAFTSAARKHQVSFSKLSNTGIAGRLARSPGVVGGFAEVADIRKARALCDLWKKALSSGGGAGAGPT